MKMLHIKLLIISSIMMPTSLALAAQKYKVGDGDTVRVQISAKELSRITVEGDLRIDKVWDNQKDLEIKPDKSLGEIFVRPKIGSRRNISFFVRDSAGSTYTILAQKKDIPSQTIVLSPKVRQKRSLGFKGRSRSLPYKKRVKNLVRAMASGIGADKYSVEEVNRAVVLWRETRITLRHTFTGQKLNGELYYIENESGKPIVFNEKEFLGFGEDVAAVALKDLKLGVSESTYLYVVRRRSE